VVRVSRPAAIDQARLAADELHMGFVVRKRGTGKAISAISELIKSNLSHLGAYELITSKIALVDTWSRYQAIVEG
jgi:hypothetical protein